MSRRSSSSSSDLSAEDLREFDAAECEDDDEAGVVYAMSLFDDFSSPSSMDVWTYMKRVHGFDLNELRNSIPDFDDFKRIALTNFLRRRQQHTVGTSDDSKLFVPHLGSMIGDWNAESNLVPVKENDRLLWELPSDYDEEEEKEKKEDQHNHTDNLEAQIALLSDELKRIRSLFGEPSIRSSSARTIPEPLGGVGNGVSEQFDEVKTEEERTVSESLDQDKNYFESYSRLSIHREMILDAPRTSAYGDFISAASAQLKGKVVLDVGCGSGILSMFCARAGARLVVGVDAASETLKTARNIIRSNKFGDLQIQLLSGKLEDCDLWFSSTDETEVISTLRGSAPPAGAVPFVCDAIVSEWMGYALLYESMFCTVIDARDRFMKLGGLVIPSKACMQMWAADFSPTLHQNIDVWDMNLYDFDLSLLKPDEEKYLKSPEVTVVEPQCLRSPPCTFVELDLSFISKKDLQRIRSKFCLSVRGEVTSVVLSFFCLFEAPGVKTVRLETSPKEVLTHWRQTLCHLMTPEKKRLRLPPNTNTTISGYITLAPGSSNSRHLSIVLELNPIDLGDGQYVGSCVNTFELK